jgi:urease accessory protein
MARRHTHCCTLTLITTAADRIGRMPHALSLLRLLHLASPALPIGAFHFSQGLEHAVHAQWVHDAASAQAWIDGLAGHALGTLDLPLLCRLYGAWQQSDPAALQRWNQLLLASRETAELRAEERHLGAALGKVLRELEVAAPADGGYGYVSMFALACVTWSITLPQALETYAWVWLENQVLAAVKLVPLGQSAGQRILHALLPRIASITVAALAVSDEDIGTGALMQIVASSCHELQYSRLFRS